MGSFSLLVRSLFVAYLSLVVNGFATPSPNAHRHQQMALKSSKQPRMEVVDDWESATFDEQTPSDLEEFLSTKFPGFFYLLKKNDEAMQLIRSHDTGITLFAPNADALNELGKKRLAQLEDERNLETCEKIVAYHVVATEALPASRLFTEDWTKGRPKGGGKPAFTVEGVNTMGGIIPVGGKTGSEPVLGTANVPILKSYTAKKGTWIVHEMKGLVSPELLWRYCDQLRIPGF